jgi:Tfp pilus assembly protein PilP
VASAATVENAINLRQINLIGVYGRPNDRRALVRLSNGRYVRVGVGDSLDGGRVAAINDNTLNYVKSGRTVTLEIPSG